MNSVGIASLIGKIQVFCTTRQVIIPTARLTRKGLRKFKEVLIDE